MLRRDLLADVAYRVDVDLLHERTRSRVEFACRQPGASTFADLAVPSVDSMTLNGTPLPTSAWSDGRLPLSDLESTNVLEVVATFSTTPPDGRGLMSFVDEGGERFVYTYGRTDGVARWAPCFLDVPAFWDLRIAAPDDWTVLSHSPAVRPASGAWIFAPPYALPDGPTFAAGPWIRAEGPDGVPLWSRPSMMEKLTGSPVGQFVAEALAHHADILNVRYPYETRDCAFIPGYGSQAGCSGGLILCHERVLHASLEQEWQRYVRWLIAHETAHSWFGGLVGFSAAEHRWTAEGLATYLCHVANNSWDRFHVLEELEAHRDDDAGGDAPSLIYAKPAALVRHLESVIGTTALLTGLTRWLGEYAGGSSTGDDLVRAWSQAAGRDLSPWAADWLYTPGANTLSYDRRTSTIQQEGTPLREHHLAIQAFGADLAPRPPVDVVVTGETTVVAGVAADAELIVLNVPLRTYAKTRLDETSREILATRLGELGDDARAACWVAAVEMTQDGLMPITEVNAWVEAFGASEPDPQVRDLLVAVMVMRASPTLPMRSRRTSGRT